MQEFLSEFKSPGAKWRGKPFWSWNGKLEKQELLRQIDILKEMGMGGYFMHSRTGLQTEYLGDEWFECVNACVEKGTIVGLESWIYDEDRWPSGTCGGVVTRERKHRAKFIRGQVVSFDKFSANKNRYLEKGGEQFLETIAIFYAELNKFSLGNYVQIPINKLSTLPEKRKGWSFLIFSIEEEKPNSFYNGETWVDTLSREATEAYLKSTHEIYKARCGKFFSKGIKGTFTDEPNRGTIFSRFNLKNEDPKWMVPYTPTLFKSYFEAFGEDLKGKLPELYFWKGGEKVSPVKWRYVEIIQRLFIQNYAKPIYEWHEENGLKLTGHILHEDTLAAQTTVSGSMMRYYPHMHYPGVDILSESNRNYNVAIQLRSSARQNGQKWLLSELYGCTGWQFNFEGHKWVGDWQALLGINLRCHHLSWYTMEGEAKRDYPASILHQSTWYKDYTLVETYFARLGLIMSQGKPVCELLVINPVESIWAQIYPGGVNGLSSKDRTFKNLETQYHELSQWLMGSGIDFDYGDEGIMEKTSKIENENGQVFLCIGEARYTSVVVGGVLTIRSSTLNILKEFANMGGKIIFAGPPPKYIDAISSQSAIELAKRCISCNWKKSEIITSLDFLPSVTIIDSETGRPTEDVFVQLRKDEDSEFLVAMNMNRKKAYPKLEIQWQYKGALTEFDLLTGRFWRFQNINKNQRLVLSLAEAGSIVLGSNYQGAESLPVTTPKTVIGQESVLGPFAYELDEENICVLEDVSWKINNSNWHYDNVLKADQKIRDILGIERRGGEMIQPWYRQKYHKEECEKIHGKLTLQYAFKIKKIPETDITLAIENPEKWDISINRNPLKNTPENGFWIDIAFKKIIISRALMKKGENTIEIRTDFREETNCEAIYLLGKFSVKLRRRTRILDELPDQIKVGSIIKQGFPFYSGKLTYLLPIRERIPSAIQIPVFEGACVAVSDNKGRKVIPWKPFETDLELNDKGNIKLEVILTRRNTFGPLHQIPLRAGSYGPGNFITPKPLWKNTCNLYPAGLLDKPYFLFKE